MGVFEFYNDNITISEFEKHLSGFSADYIDFIHDCMKAAAKGKFQMFYQKNALNIIPDSIIDLQGSLMISQSILQNMNATKMTLEWNKKDVVSIYRIEIFLDTFNTWIAIRKIYIDKVIITQEKISGFCFQDSENWFLRENGSIDYSSSTKYKKRLYIGVNGIDCSLLSSLYDENFNLMSITLNWLAKRFPFASVLQNEFDAGYNIFPSIKWDKIKHCKTKSEALEVLHPHHDSRLDILPFMTSGHLCNNWSCFEDIDVVDLLNKIEPEITYNRLKDCKSQKFVKRQLIMMLGWELYKKIPRDNKNRQCAIDGLISQLLDEFSIVGTLRYYPTIDEIRNAYCDILTSNLLKKLPVSFFKGPVLKPCASMAKVTASSDNIIYIDSKSKLRNVIKKYCITYVNMRYIDQNYYGKESPRTTEEYKILEQKKWHTLMTGIESGKFIMTAFIFESIPCLCLIDKCKKQYDIQASLSKDIEDKTDLSTTLYNERFTRAKIFVENNIIDKIFRNPEPYYQIKPHKCNNDSDDNDDDSDDIFF